MVAKICCQVYAKENNIEIGYIDGTFEAGFVIILSEDGSTFEYEEKVYTRK